MLTTIYAVSLILGGVFVLLSVLAGFGDSEIDVEADADVDMDLDADADFDADLDADVDADADFDADADIDADADVDADADADSVGDVEAVRHKKFRPWFSFKFYTYGLAFFGLTGLLLTQLGGVGEPWGAGISAVMGLTTGLAVSYLMHYIDKGSVSSRASGQRDFLGAQAEVLLPVEEGRTGRVRVHLENRTVDMRAEPAEEGVVLDTDDDCYVLDMSDGTVQVIDAEALKLRRES